MLYYAVADDATSALLIYRALRAAERGVRVRLLVDDLSAVGRDVDLATLAAHPNVQVTNLTVLITLSFSNP